MNKEHLMNWATSMAFLMAKIELGLFLFLFCFSFLGSSNAGKNFLNFSGFLALAAGYFWCGRQFFKKQYRLAGSVAAALTVSSYFLLSIVLQSTEAAVGVVRLLVHLPLIVLFIIAAK